MAKRIKTPPQVNPALDPMHIGALNDLAPGLGNAVSQALTSLANVQAAHAGLKGTPVLAEQKRKDPRGKTALAMDYNGGRSGNAAPAIDGTDHPILSQVRQLIADDVNNQEEPKIPDPQKSVCQETAFGHLRTVNSGFNNVHCVEVMGPYVFVAGE